MLLSLMGGCADECSVVWPYLLISGDTDGKVAPDNVENLRAEFAAVVEERCRRRRLILLHNINELKLRINKLKLMLMIKAGHAASRESLIGVE
jgi:hypothetical protein